MFASLGAALQALPSGRFSSSSLRGGGGTGSSSPRSRVHPVLNAFEIDLTSQLEHLKESATASATTVTANNVDDERNNPSSVPNLSRRGCCYLSLSWLCQAMELVLSIHSNVEAFVPDLQHALDEGNNKWLEDYLEESVKLLDVCNVLRETAVELKGYQRSVEIALHSLERGDLGMGQLRRAKAAIAKCTDFLKRKDDPKRPKLENCSSTLRRMGERLHVEDASVSNFFNAIYAAQITAIFFCGVVAAALSFKSRRPLTVMNIAGQSSWSSTLSGLQQKVKEQVDKKKMKGSNALLDELDQLDLALRVLQEVLEKELVAMKKNEGCSSPLRRPREVEDGIRQAIAAVKGCSFSLVHGLASLESQIEELFGVLVASRMILLDMYGRSSCRGSKLS